MSRPIRALKQLLSSMSPERQAGVWVYAACPYDSDLRDLQPLATFREREALTVIVREEEALAAGLSPLFRCAWIMLKVHSDLEAVGLTAAVATALTECGISCNVLAAAYHDHIFVPIERADDAVAALLALQRRSAALGDHEQDNSLLPDDASDANG